MKKIIFTTLVAIVAVSAASFVTLIPEKEVSKLTFDNVDALSDGEPQTGYDSSTVKTSVSPTRYEKDPNTGEMVSFYLEFTQTTCEGSGPLKCSPGTEIRTIFL